MVWGLKPTQTFVNMKTDYTWIINSYLIFTRFVWKFSIHSKISELSGPAVTAALEVVKLI